jgi:diguanylate cyclase (GGDEF)-like protein
VTFGRRLGLLFLLIVVVPMATLVGVLIFVSEDSRTGKADSRLAAGLETAIAHYAERTSESRDAARGLAIDTRLLVSLRTGDAGRLDSFARDLVDRPSVAAVEILGRGGDTLASAGDQAAIAFGQIQLDSGGPLGVLRVSVTTAADYVAEVKRLTRRDLVVSRDGETLAATVSLPETTLEPGETRDVTLAGEDFRARALELDERTGERMLLLGPQEEGGLLSIEGPVLAVVIGFLLIAIAFAVTLARALTGLHETVAEQAVTDPLTGLWNRRRLQEVLISEAARAKRFGHPLSLLIVDVDDFKKINDTYGHLQGDAVLGALAEVIRRETRAIDEGARFGGDEMALVLLETGADGAEALAERVRTRVRQRRIPRRNGDQMSITVSVGAATLPDSATDADGLIEAADAALYRAKRSGKDKIRSAPGRARHQAAE